MVIDEVEQDYMYWPLKYKDVAELWRLSTTLGKLFQQYQGEGYLKRGDGGTGFKFLVTWVKDQEQGYLLDYDHLAT